MIKFTLINPSFFMSTINIVNIFVALGRLAILYQIVSLMFRLSTNYNLFWEGWARDLKFMSNTVNAWEQNIVNIRTIRPKILNTCKSSLSDFIKANWSQRSECRSRYYFASVTKTFRIDLLIIHQLQIISFLITSTKLFRHLNNNIYYDKWTMREQSCILFFKVSDHVCKYHAARKWTELQNYFLSAFFTYYYFPPINSLIQLAFKWFENKIICSVGVQVISIVVCYVSVLSLNNKML